VPADRGMAASGVVPKEGNGLLPSLVTLLVSLPALVGS